MVRIVSVEQMRALENEANMAGLSYAQMMQNAGMGSAKQIEQKFVSRKHKTITGLVGSGNNGGDTLVALRYLQQHGWQTYAYLLSDRTIADPLVADYVNQNGSLAFLSKDPNFNQLDELIHSSPFLLDGILGTGTHLPLRGSAQAVLQFLAGKEKLPYVIALDCPSGVDCDSGEMDEATLPADWTICIAAVKQGLLRFPAFSCVGFLSVVDISLPSTLPSWGIGGEYCIDASFVAKNLPTRPLQAHKGTFGTTLAFAGSSSFPGAALLVGKAAYLVGAGLVKLASIPQVQLAIAGSLPEVTWYLLKAEDSGFTYENECTLKEILKNADSVLIGPGWGTATLTSAFFVNLLGMIKEVPQPRLIIDADGLNLLAQNTDLFKKLPPNTVLTPHPGEMARLTGLSVAEIQRDREEVARGFAKKWNCVLILKGALTVVAAPDGKLAINPIATAALAKAGSGDVLAGMIAGFLAQQMDAFRAACLAVWLHGQAGRLAAHYVGDDMSVLASDVLEAIPRALRCLQ